MRIIEMHVTPIAVGDPPLLNAAGLHAPYALRTIIEIVTDDDITGLGEVPGSAETTAALEAAAEVVDRSRSVPTQRDLPWTWSSGSVLATNQTTWWAGSTARSSTSSARSRSPASTSWARRRAGPWCDLLGGRARDRVDFSAYLFYKYAGAGGELGFGIDPAASGWAAARQAAALDPAGIVAQAQAMCREFGFKSLKLKGGVFPPDEEVAAIHALREAFGPNTPLRLDPNAIWTVETAIAAGHQMEGVLEYYEDPVRGQEAMAAVRGAVKMPLATNMCTTSFEDLPGSMRLGSEDIILSDHHFWGGLRASVELARICRTFGRGLSMHSNSHIGISLAAMTHLAAAVPNLTYACDTHYPWQSEEVIVGGRLKFEDGALPVPTGPGLGIELDRAALARLHENYLRCGLTRRNDEIEMQKVQPGWRFEATRW